MAQAPASLQILVVEDIETMRQLLEYLLKGVPEVRGVGLAKNSLEARVELTRRRPHLVILDEVLPGESSLDLLAELVRLDLPVLVMSGSEGESGGRPVPSGAQGRLQKPSWGSVDEDRGPVREAILKALRG